MIQCECECRMRGSAAGWLSSSLTLVPTSNLKGSPVDKGECLLTGALSQLHEEPRVGL